MNYIPILRLCLVAVLLCCTTAALAQHCLKPLYIDNAPGEPNFERGASVYTGYGDTLMIDTCRTRRDLKDLYAKERFRVSFGVGVVPSWVTQATTTVDFTWQDLSVSHPEVRSTMQSIAQRFGSYVIRRYVNPPKNSPWKTPGVYQVRFAQYTNLDSLEKWIRPLGIGGSVDLWSDFVVTTSLSDDRAVLPARSLGIPLSLWPNPASHRVRVEAPVPVVADMWVEVCALHGAVVLRSKAVAADGNATANVETGNLAPGVYWCRMYTATGVVGTAPVVIVR